MEQIQTSEKSNHLATKHVLTVKEYRKLLNDFKSTDEQIIKRIKYLELTCRKMIQTELKNYVKGI